MGALAPNIEMANAITGIAYSLKELNRVEEATQVLDGAIDLLREGCYPFVGDTLRTKASWLEIAGRYEEAIATYLEAVQINEIDGETEFVGRDLLAISLCFSKMSRWEEVIEHASRAREHFKKEKLVDEVAICEVQIAHAYIETGHVELALDIAQRAHDIGEIRRNESVKVHSAIALGKIYRLTEKYQEAEERFEEAREITSGSDDWETVITIEREFIKLLTVQEKLSEAEEVERRLKSLLEVIECNQI